MSSTLEVNVKWGKEAITISFAPDQGVKALKAELEEKTGVPADRMKIMPKSKGTCRCDFIIFVVLKECWNCV